MTTDGQHELLEQMRRVRAHVATHGDDILERWKPRLQRAEFADSADNLARYLAFRQLDLRPIQAELTDLGLSSLGQVEGRVLPGLDAVIATLELMCRSNAETPRPTAVQMRRGREALEHGTLEVLGPPPGGRRTRIMVTLSAKAAKDADHVRELVDAGMDCARINCARTGPDEWAAMVTHVRAAAEAAGRACPVLMDLGGPKIRTRDATAPKDRSDVHPGDRILLSYEKPKRNAKSKAKDEPPFQASCTLPDVLRQVGAGAQICIRDGLIRGVVDEVRPDGLVVSVVRTPPDGHPWQNQRGINFPDTDLLLTPLTDDDLTALDFAAKNADMIGYSFVQRPEDMARLQSEIISRHPNGAPIPIVAKIETRLAFANLPEIIVQAAGANPFAVMIARGDLAVEIGYERLSEVQEEILWVCEAARVPVIWATQVLESVVKRGMPSRGEFTDAAMGERAECVMLNKGPYIAEGIAVLDDVLRRMQSHQSKRTSQLRPLRAWERLY